MAPFTTLMKAAQWVGASPALHRSSLLHTHRPLAPLCHGRSPSHNLFGRIPSGLSDNGEEAFSKHAALSWGPECVAARSVCLPLIEKPQVCSCQLSFPPRAERTPLYYICQFSACLRGSYAAAIKTNNLIISASHSELRRRNHHLHYFFLFQN